MAKKKYEEANIQSIADAIREKTGTDDTYKTSEMASGVNEVYEAGKQEEVFAYWNAITNNGKRSHWDYAFAYTDYSEIEFPKPVVVKGTPQRLFRMYAGAKLPRKEDIDMTSITSALAMFSYIYSGSRKITVPDYGIPALNSYETFCDNSTCIETIEIIRCHEGTGFSSAFVNCRGLKNITFEGVIGQNVNLSWSPLTITTLKNLISHLKDYAGTDKEYTYTLTLSSASKTLLDAEGATSPNGNTWSQYVDDLGWNLA